MIYPLVVASLMLFITMIFISEKSKDPERIGKFNLLLTAAVYHVCFLSCYPIIKEVSEQKDNKFELLLKLLRISPWSRFKSYFWTAQLKVLANSFFLSFSIFPLVFHLWQLGIQLVLFIILSEIAVLFSLLIATLLPYCYQSKLILCQMLPVFILMVHPAGCPGAYIIPYNTFCEKSSLEEVAITGAWGIAIIIILIMVYTITQRFSFKKSKIQSEQLIEADASQVSIQDATYLQQGEILSIIGLNNSGKSTLLQIISGIIQPESGSISIFGFNPRDQQCPSIYLSQQKDHLLDELSLVQHLEMIFDLSSQDKEEKEIRVNQLLNQLFTNPEKKQPVSQLSYGTRKKLLIAMALISDAKLILLDEPFVGIDDICKEKIFKLIKKDVSAQKRILIYTTNSFSHVVHLADLVCIQKDFKAGELMSVNQLRDKYCMPYRIYFNQISQFAQLNSTQQQNLIQDFKRQFSWQETFNQAIMIPYNQMYNAIEYIQNNATQYEQYFNIEIVRNNEEDAYKHILKNEDRQNKQEDYMSHFSINQRESVDQFVRNQQDEIISKKQNTSIFINNYSYSLFKAILIISPWTINSVFYKRKADGLMILYILNICLCLSLFKLNLSNQFHNRLRFHLHLLGIKTSTYLFSLLKADFPIFTLGVLLNSILAMFMTFKYIDNIIFFTCTCFILFEMLSFSYLLCFATKYSKNIVFYQTSLMFVFGFMFTASGDFLFDSELKYQKSIETLVFINPITFLYWSSDEPRNRFYYIEYKATYLIFHILMGVSFYTLAILFENNKFESKITRKLSELQPKEEAKVSINNLQYKQIINDINLQINENQVLGVIGINASGKSKLIEVISGIIQSDFGSIKINNQETNLNSGQLKFTSIFEGETLFNDRTVRENFHFILSLRKIPQQIREAIMLDEINNLELDPLLDSKVKDLGYSTQKKIQTISALLTDQPLIFMDDPTRHFDYFSSQKFQQKVKNIREKAIIYATNNIEEAENISDQIAVIKEGQIKLQGTSRELLESVSQDRFLKITLNEKSDMSKIINKILKKHQSYLELTKSPQSLIAGIQDQSDEDSDGLHHHFNSQTITEQYDFIEFRFTVFEQNQQSQRIIIQIIKEMIILQQKGKIEDFFIHQCNMQQVLNKVNRF